MKKIFLGILTMMYMTVSAGIGVDVHYCMGKKVGFELYGPSPDGKCGKCGMKDKDKKAGCCQDQHKFYKLSDSHKNVTNNLSLAGAGISVVSLGAIFQPKPPVHISSVEDYEYTPPDDTRPSPLIFHCIFRK